MPRSNRTSDHEGRPLCRECGKLCPPRGTRHYKRDATRKDRSLLGHYCGDDCLLDAFQRGWPRFYRTGKGK